MYYYMIPYNYEIIGPTFFDNIRHIAYHNKDTILGNPKDGDRIMKQLNGHLESMKSTEPFDKAIEYKTKRLNTAFLNDNLEFSNQDKFHKNDTLKEKFRQNMLGLKEMREMVDPVYKYHLAIAGPFERKLLKFYNELEDEYYTRLYVTDNIDETDYE